jgi:hypothetical protein
MDAQILDVAKVLLQKLNLYIYIYIYMENVRFTTPIQ